MKRRSIPRGGQLKAAPVGASSGKPGGEPSFRFAPRRISGRSFLARRFLERFPPDRVGLPWPVFSLILGIISILVLVFCGPWILMLVFFPSAGGPPGRPGLSEFVRPSFETQLQAIGSLDGLPDVLGRAFTPHRHFDPIADPAPGDWLAVHEEEGQSYDTFLKTRRNIPDSRRRKIYLLPIGDEASASGPSLDTLRDFTKAFFPLDVVVLDRVPIQEGDFSPRVNGFTGKPQIHGGEVLRHLATLLPEDGFCILALTMTDLYPEPDWNFVFGLASVRARTGVQSFARYDPCFGGAEARPGDAKLVLERTLKVLAHETTHMFGILHCVHFDCLLCGSNHLAEADEKPLHLCPVCLRKLHSSLQFDPVKRYRALESFYRGVSLDDEARWIARRVAWIEGGSAKGLSEARGEEKAGAASRVEPNEEEEDEEKQEVEEDEETETKTETMAEPKPSGGVDTKGE